MLPAPGNKLTNGIAQVLAAYARYLPRYGVELTTGDTYDLLATHAGLGGAQCDVAHLHGLYWTADYDAPTWEYATNADIVAALRVARQVTVPSQWVAATLRRDMHLSPVVVPHGIEWEQWQDPTIEHLSYTLWNKNRSGDVCDTTPLQVLADARPTAPFVTTFIDRPRTNVKVTGVLPHAEMKALVQHAGVYLATTKETFGIGILEAMASGVPILGYAWGGVVDLVQHGINGYLAQPGNNQDLLAGYDYCVQHRHTLGANGRALARAYTWETATRQVADLYHAALAVPQPTAAIVIPAYNYGHLVGRAIESALRQTYPLLVAVVVVDDGSTDGTAEAVAPYLTDSRVRYLRQDNQGVAHARNHGIATTDATYLCCLDADDSLEPEFLSTCIAALEADRSLGIAYTSLSLVTESGKRPGIWPGEFNYDAQVQGHNQIPTCCVFRRTAWERSGGYRQRYAPGGCGSEDAEFWLRLGSLGYHAARVSDRPLFNYYMGGRTSDRRYQETAWRDWHPWTVDQRHPFASVATPVKASHPVHQYDNPYVSVIIPIGPGHEQHVIEALDSLEAQTMREWEGIAVWDTGTPLPATLQKAYPHIQWIVTAGKIGAGAARNLGAAAAHSNLLLFLDADDWLLPQALETLLQAYNEHEAIVYCASLGLRVVDTATADTYRQRNELISYERGIAAIHQGITPYNYELAIRQPFTDPPYFWCYVSSLLPKAWHDAIGGFDEGLAAWEDWDYWIRLAKAGYDFVAVNSPLIVYCYDTGQRRELGKTLRDDLREQLTTKHKEIPIMACKGCGNKAARPVALQPPPMPTIERMSTTMDQNFVLIEYLPLRGGSHGVIGVTTFGQKLADTMRRTNGGWVFDYGYRSRGDRFLVHVADQKAMPNVFVIVATPVAPRVTVAPTPLPPPPTAPALLEAKTLMAEPPTFDLQTVPGITPILAKALLAAGYDTREKLLAGDLTSVKGIGAAKAAAIKEALATPVDTANVLEELRRQLGGS